MTNNQITIAFFNLTETKVKDDVLTSIAKHYGISNEEALAEVLDDEAESLLDYLTGSVRTATHVLMQKHGLA
jgi:hypothetical protein